jgi:hypothetical protein
MSFNTILDSIPCIGDKYRDQLQNSCVVHFIKCSEKSSVASAKIARFIAKLLGVPLIHEIDDFKDSAVFNKDLIFFVNSPFVYCDFRKDFYEMIKVPDQRRVWIQNDYALEIRAPEPIFWTTIPDKFIKNPKDSYINWNQLSYIPQDVNLSRTNGLMYYGAFRKGRLNYFEKYLKDCLYPCFISTTPKHAPKFKEFNDKIIILKKFPSLIETISQYSASLYIEDNWSNKHFCSPANRFYECLSAGVAILFDKSCEQTMQIAGYDVSKYVVDSKEELNMLLKFAPEVAREQVKLWRRDYIGNLVEQVDTALNVLFN